MIATNNLTDILFEDIGPIPPTSFDLSTYVPEGALLPEHIEYRYRGADTFFGQYVPVLGWDEATRTATVNLPANAVAVQFRRNTPRYSLVENPLAADSRFTARHLRINADQGMMVALELAAQYGIDGHAMLVSGRSPISEIGKLYSQCHWGSSTDYTRKVWDFRFSGGYLDMTHVRVQAKINGAWVSIPLDYTRWDDPTPNGARYRFIGPYQLWLDFQDEASSVTALIIYRRTPRESKVSRPEDGAVATAESMDPSARHALFVAVELGEELSHNVPSCECRRVYTSVPYPVLVDESIQLAASGSGVTTDTPIIVESILPTSVVSSFSLRDVVQPYNVLPPDRVLQMATVSSMILTSVVRNYNDWPQEKFSANSTVVGSVLTTVVQSYNNWPQEKLSASATVSGVSLV